jgi:hypothetical protein
MFPYYVWLTSPAGSSKSEHGWSGALFYSKTLKSSFGMSAPYEQYGLYATLLGGIYLLGRGYGRIHKISKALEHDVGHPDRVWHRGLGNGDRR